jgi:hypothetical protein
MSSAQLHLALNHTPIYGLLFGLGILAAGFGLKHLLVRRVGLVVLALGALSVLPAYLSGEPAEEMMENRPGISEERIEEHEEASEFALVLSLLASAAAGFALALPRLKRPRAAAHEGKATTAAAVLAVLALAALGRTAHLGGMISHPELRSEDGAHSR